MKRILYISDLNEAAPIFHSQVIPHVRELKKNFDVTLVILNRSSTASHGQEDAVNYHSIKGDYIYYLAGINFLKQKGKMRAILKNVNFDLIYSRGIRGGIVGSFIKKSFYSNRITLLNDIRGDALDGQNRNFINKAISSHATKLIYNNADILFVVSNFLKEKICGDYSFNSNKAYVFPTFVPDNKFDFNEENRKNIRKGLDFRDTDIVILYSGSLVKFQNVETILSAFRLSSNPNLKMLILTKDKEIKPLVEKYGLATDRIRIKSMVYEDIEKYYHAADFGILIRDNTNTNKSAAPTKFAEYVNSGLSLIINSIDADYVRIFKEKKLEGFLLEKKEDLLDCFNNITMSHIQRNVLTINTLSELVNKQKEILNNLKI